MRIDVSGTSGNVAFGCVDPRVLPGVVAWPVPPRRLGLRIGGRGRAGGRGRGRGDTTGPSVVVLPDLVERDAGADAAGDTHGKDSRDKLQLHDDLLKAFRPGGGPFIVRDACRGS